ncbi:ATP-binding protein [Carnobacterium gallinarum]|uniref:sensor histidine kinase n=1 Tax=Carnobacterium gallinarum TaxID=2749 RepID=UPI0005507F9B|nr:HAMP domain-containing sensor histidine kinase [Carnobacterium gallinarum]
MKSLHKLIVGTTFLVMIISFLAAFLISNIYYQFALKPVNDAKVTKVAEEVQDYFKHNASIDMDDYLTHISNLGYEIYSVSSTGNQNAYGDSFRKKELPSTTVDGVLNGTTYHGIAEFPKSLFITGFFDNDIRNTIGIPIQNGTITYAVFIRPDPAQQFGELRIFFALLLLLTITIGFCLIFLGSHFIVTPIKNLTHATQKFTNNPSEIIKTTRRKDEIGQLTNSFATMATEISKAEQARQEFVANVSHEIQTPLTSIQGYSTFLKDNTLTQEQRLNYLTIIESETARLSDLTKQLLTLAYLDNESQLTEGKKVDITKQIRQFIQFTQWKWQAKNIYLVTNLQPAFVTGNENFLYQIWQNLLTNAIRYTPDDGEIIIQLIEDNENYLISFFNSGAGIDDDVLPHLFDRFYQGNPNQIQKDSGSGLGLAITKKIIQLHQGTIHIESQKNHGTTFAVTLPKTKL